MKKKIFIAILPLAFLISCQGNPEKEQNLEQLDKSSAREVILSTKEVGDSVYHITQQKIWSNNQLVTEKFDTIKTVKSINPSDSTATPIYVTIQ
jgi:hypothetical protein